LKAYETTAFKVIKRGGKVTLKFGDVARLKIATKHPAAGTGNLQIKSWMEWVLDGVQSNRGFVPSNRLGKAKKNSRLSGGLGGLMLPKGVLGSSGLWRFPQALSNYEDEWFKKNAPKVQAVIIKKTLEIFTRKLSG
jgi:hypothetical protein